MTDVPRWYTRVEFAARCRVAPKTVSNWLWQERRAGRGPTRAQAYRKDLRSGGCLVLIRSDYALALWQRYGASVKRNPKFPLRSSR